MCKAVSDGTGYSRTGRSRSDTGIGVAASCSDEQQRRRRTASRSRPSSTVARISSTSLRRNRRTRGRPLHRDRLRLDLWTEAQFDRSLTQDGCRRNRKRRRGREDRLKTTCNRLEVVAGRSRVNVRERPGCRGWSRDPTEEGAADLRHPGDCEPPACSYLDQTRRRRQSRRGLRSRPARGGSRP